MIDQLIHVKVESLWLYYEIKKEKKILFFLSCALDKSDGLSNLLVGQVLYFLVFHQNFNDKVAEYEELFSIGIYQGS